MSKIDICNQALAVILNDPISSLDDVTSKEARLCNLFYDQCRTSLLRLFPFNFAIKKIQPSVISDVTLYDWTYAYLYPIDCLYIIAVTPYPSLNAVNPSVALAGYYNKPRNIDLSSITKYDINIDGNYKLVYSNIENAYIVYVYDAQDTTKFDSLFTECLSYSLANKLAMSLAGDMDLVKMTQQLFYQLLSQAKEVNAQEGNDIVPVFDKYIRARRS